MEAVLALLIVGWAISHVYEDVTGKRRADRDKRIGEIAKKMPSAMTPSQKKKLARKHAAGWTAREVLTGFPVTRTAWHSAWLSHRIAAIQQRHQREEARTTHAEVTAGLAKAMAGHKERQAVIKAEIDQAVEAAPQPPRSAKAVKQAAGARIYDFPAPVPDDEPPPEQPERGPYAVPATPEDAPLPSDATWPTGIPHRRKDDAVAQAAAQYGPREGAPTTSEAAARAQAREASKDGRPRHVVNHTPEGSTLTATYLNGDLVQPGAPATTTTTGGVPVPAAEMTYDQTVAAANELASQCEQQLSDLRLQRIGNAMDTLGGVALDPGSLGRLADANDALNEQIRATQATHDTVIAFRDGLQRDHGNLNEAHQSASVEAADKEFYQG